MELAQDLSDDQAWALPVDPTCARQARSLLRAALTGHGVPPDPIEDALLMVSELATNALQHAAGNPPHELWLSFTGRFEFCVAVFDALPMRTLPKDLTRADHGRGLSIIAELSKGRWGTDPASARLDPLVRGKIVWFVCSF